MRSLAIVLLLWVAIGSGSAAEITVGLASVDDGLPNRYDGGHFNGKLASGARFSDGMFVAHRDLPLGSCVDVSVIGRNAQVHNAKIDDRGPCDTPVCRQRSPWLLERLLDLKPKLASLIGCDGLCRVAFWPAPCTTTP